MSYIFRKKWWEEYVRPKLRYIYTINNKFYMLFYGNIRVFTAFNLSDQIEKQLRRINGFYEVLIGVEETETKNNKLENWKLLDTIEYDKKENISKCLEYAKKWNYEDTLDLLTWYGNGMEESAYRIVYDCVDDDIYYGYDDMDIKEEEKIEGNLTRQEFNLLMQIYYGVYDDDRLRKELEEKERSGEYDKIKKYVNDEMMNEIFFTKKLKLSEEEKKLLEDYLKLELMRKDTEGAFPELEIKKIYDANWDEEEQKKVVEKINKELGKEVVILEE